MRKVWLWQQQQNGYLVSLKSILPKALAYRWGAGVDTTSMSSSRVIFKTDCERLQVLEKEARVE